MFGHEGSESITGIGPMKLRIAESVDNNETSVTGDLSEAAEVSERLQDALDERVTWAGDTLGQRETSLEVGVRHDEVEIGG